ncbi:lysine histidine transporter-like 8 [Senna tora]|uniref:Lysine histidine transporter-like 8 n=1 Tax=Senna tora TaxID=362788 RepID=A0A834SU84_9FABA|nr:lysine histidine transporter-like 8 [Senna tora]
MAASKEINSAPITPRTASVMGTPNQVASPPISCPPSQFHSPSLSRSPLLHAANGADDLAPGEPQLPHPLHARAGHHHVTSKTPKTPRTPRTPRQIISSLTPRFITPLGSPMRKALRFTKLDPQDAWLPITESRNGNRFYAAFHTLCSGIGIQALVLPVAFTVLGWTWGTISLTVGFAWQLYTLWLLVHLHENVDQGIRYSRYLQLIFATFGEKMGKLLAFFPIMYLSAGTCSTIIIIGGSTARTFYQVVCGPNCANPKPLTTVEWYLVFTCAAVVLSQLPNLNSIAGLSLVGALTAVGYCTSIWAVSVDEGALPGVSYDPLRSGNDATNAFNVLNALGVVAFAFRGHNLILEIQATMPSSEKHPSHVPMWQGVKVSYTLIAACLFPLAIGGYWAYGHQIPSDGGMLTALYQFHSTDVSRVVLGMISLLVVVNGLCSFQIYGMPIFDDMESQYTKRMKKPCPWWLRSAFRIFSGFVCFFISAAIPFLSKLAGLVGGVSLPVTLAYPCFMWLKNKKPKNERSSSIRCFTRNASWCSHRRVTSARRSATTVVAASPISSTTPSIALRITKTTLVATDDSSDDRLRLPLEIMTSTSHRITDSDPNLGSTTRRHCLHNDKTFRKKASKHFWRSKAKSKKGRRSVTLLDIKLTDRANRQQSQLRSQPATEPNRASGGANRQQNQLRSQSATEPNRASCGANRQQSHVATIAYGNNNKNRAVLFIFGDSTADVGTNNFLNTTAQANVPYYGIDFPHSKPTGRFSNAFNTLDHIARLLGYKKSPPPFLVLEKRQSFNKDIFEGVNFASGGSGILRETGKDQWGEVLDLGKQVEQFALVRGNMSKMLGEMHTESYVSKALFIISAGSNDLFDFARINNATDDPFRAQLYLALLQSTYYTHIKNLYGLGARKFGIISVPPIGCCPAARAEKFKENGGKCVASLNEFASVLHSAINATLIRLSSELSDFKYSLGNSFAMTMSVLKQPLAFGFKVTKSACCGIGDLNGDGPCVKAKNAKLCRNRNDHLFWDWFHPSDNASHLAAVTLLDGPPEFLTPINFSQLAVL